MLAWALGICASLLLIGVEKARGVVWHGKGIRSLAIMFIAASSALAVAFFAASFEDLIVDGLSPFQMTRISRWDLGPTFVALTSFLLLDFVQYALHRISHAVSVFWRCHSLHHVDEDVGPFTSLLHHPFEAIFVYVVSIAVAVLFGVPLLVLILYGLMSGLHAAFVHSRLRLPETWDRWARMILVTPSMHRVHHSILEQDGHSNFGNILSIWDRLMGTYQAKTLGEVDRCGLAETSQGRALTIWGLLALPFR